jgi:urea transporter
MRPTPRLRGIDWCDCGEYRRGAGRLPRGRYARFNGALAGLAAYTFVADEATAAALAILAGISTAWLLQPWSRWLRARGLGVYSSPCLIVTWLWLPLVKAGSAASPVAHVAILAPFPCGVLAGLAQTGFACGAVSGCWC